MTSPHVDSVLVEYVANELERSKAAEVRRHLDECMMCREMLEWVSAANRIWDQESHVDPGLDFTNRVMDQLDKVRGKQRGVTVPWWKRSDMRNLMAAGVAAFMLWHGVSGIVLVNHNHIDESMQGYTTAFQNTLDAWVNDLAQLLHG